MASADSGGSASTGNQQIGTPRQAHVQFTSGVPGSSSALVSCRGVPKVECPGRRHLLTADQRQPSRRCCSSLICRSRSFRPWAARYPARRRDWISRNRASSLAHVSAFSCRRARAGAVTSSRHSRRRFMTFSRPCGGRHVGLRRCLRASGETAGIHRFRYRDQDADGMRAMTNSATGLPPMRCSWMMRSSTSGVQWRYQMPCG